MLCDVVNIAGAHLRSPLLVWYALPQLLWVWLLMAHSCLFLLRIAISPERWCASSGQPRGIDFDCWASDGEGRWLEWLGWGERLVFYSGVYAVMQLVLWVSQEIGLKLENPSETQDQILAWLSLCPVILLGSLHSESFLVVSHLCTSPCLKALCRWQTDGSMRYWW